MKTHTPKQTQKTQTPGLTQADIQQIGGTLTSEGFNYVGAIGAVSNSNFANGQNNDQLGTTASRMNPLLGIPQINVADMPPTILPQ